MKFFDVTIVLFVFFTAVLLFPILSPDITITVIPEKVETVYIHVNQPDLIISTDHDAIVQINLTRIDTDFKISNNITNEWMIEDLEVGFYQLDILSPLLGEVHINRTGFYTLPLVSFVLMGIINLYLINRKLSTN